MGSIIQIGIRPKPLCTNTLNCFTMISDYIRLWVISHPWNMRKPKESLNPTVHRSQYTSPLISSFPLSLSPTPIGERESTLQSSTALVTTSPVVPPGRHSGLPPTVIVGAGPCARPRKPTTRPCFRHSRGSGNPHYNHQPHSWRHPPWLPEKRMNLWAGLSRSGSGQSRSVRIY